MEKSCELYANVQENKSKSKRENESKLKEPFEAPAPGTMIAGRIEVKKEQPKVRSSVDGRKGKRALTPE